jgi:hypothetical protein
MTFTLDSFHPDRLACDYCGHLMGPVALNDGDDPANLDSPTDYQAAHRWPLLAEDVRLHSLRCPRRGEATQEEWERWAVARSGCSWVARPQGIFR